MSTEAMNEASPEAYASNPLVRVFAYATSDNSVLKKAAFILDAATQTITPSVANSPQGVIAYLGTFITTLEQEFKLVREGQPALETDQVAAHLFLLEKVLTLISPTIVQARSELIGRVIVDALTLCVDNAAVVKYALATIMPFIRALDTPQRKGDVAIKLFSVLVILALDPRPKIRQQAQRTTTSFLLLLHFKSPKNKGVPAPIYQTLVRIAEHELSKCKPGRDRSLYIGALHMCGLLQTTIYLLHPTAMIAIFTKLAELAAEPHMQILQIQVFRVLSALFIQGVQTRYIRRSKLQNSSVDEDTPVYDEPYRFDEDGQPTETKTSDEDGKDDEESTMSADARQKELHRVELDAPLVVELVNTFASIPPEIEDVDCVQAYARMLRLAFARIYSLSPTLAHELLPKMFANLARYLTRPNLPLVVATAAAAMRDIARTVIDSDMVDAAVNILGVQSRLSKSRNTDDVDAPLSPLENVMVQCLGLLGNSYRLVWPSIFGIVHALASRMTPAAAPLMGPILNRLDLMHRSNPAEDIQSGVEYIVGAFVASAGPEAVLGHLPLNLPMELSDNDVLISQYAQGRTWLLDVLAKNVVGARLGFWIETILPVALAQRQISEYLANDPATRYESTMVARLAEQAWEAFPAFCDLADDIPTAFNKKFAKRIGGFLSDLDLAPIHPTIFKGLRVLCARNLMVSKGLWGKNEAEFLLRAQIEEEVVEDAKARRVQKKSKNPDNSDSDSESDYESEAEEDSETEEDKSSKTKSLKNVKQAVNVDAVEELSYYGVEAERYRKRSIAPCPLSAEQAQSNLDAIAPFAPIFLPMLFNMSSDPVFKWRELVLDTIVAYTRVAPANVQASLFETALGKLKSTLADKAEVAKKFEARRAELAAEEAVQAAQEGLRGARLKVDKTVQNKSTRRGADYDAESEEEDADDESEESDSNDEEEEEVSFDNPESKDGSSMSAGRSKKTVRDATRLARERKRERRMERDAMSNYVTAARALFDILIAMMPALTTQHLAEIAEVTLPCLKDIDHMMQRKAYQVVTKLATTNSQFFNENWKTVLAGVNAASSFNQPGSAAARMAASEAVLTKIPDMLEHEEVRRVLPEILSEALLAMKDLSLNARLSSVALLRGVCGYILDSTYTSHNGNEALSSPVKEYLDIIAAGFASSTPMLKSASVTALARLLFEFRHRIPQVVTANLLETVLLMLQYKSREIVKAALGFIKVACLTLTPEYCSRFLTDIMKGVTGFGTDFKSRFKSKVRTLVTILIKKFGAERVRAICPLSDQRLVDHIRKETDRLKRQRMEQLNERNRAQRMASKGLSVDELAMDPRVASMSLGTQGRIGLNSSIPHGQTFEEVMKDQDDSDDEVEGRSAADVLAARIARNHQKNLEKGTKKQTVRNKNKGLDVTVHDDVDLVDPAAAHLMENNKHVRNAANRVLEGYDYGSATMTKTGKLDFVALQKQLEEKKSEDDSMDNLFGKRGRNEKDGRDRQLQTAATEHDREVKKNTSKLGHQYASEKAAGDARRRGQKLEPFAYIPLDPRALNKRNKDSAQKFEEAFTTNKKDLLNRKPGQKLNRAQRAALRKKGGRFPTSRTTDDDN